MTNADRQPWTTPTLQTLSVGLDTALEGGSGADGQNGTKVPPG